MEEVELGFEPQEEELDFGVSKEVPSGTYTYEEPELEVNDKIVPEGVVKAKIHTLPDSFEEDDLLQYSLDLKQQGHTTEEINTHLKATVPNKYNQRDFFSQIAPIDNIRANLNTGYGIRAEDQLGMVIDGVGYGLQHWANAIARLSNWGAGGTSDAELDHNMLALDSKVAASPGAVRFGSVLAHVGVHAGSFAINPTSFWRSVTTQGFLGSVFEAGNVKVNEKGVKEVSSLGEVAKWGSISAAGGGFGVLAVKTITKAFSSGAAPSEIVRNLESLTPEKAKDLADVIELAKQKGFKLRDIFVPGSKEADLANFMDKGNLLAIRDMFKDADEVDLAFLDHIDNTLSRLKVSSANKAMPDWKRINLEAAVFQEEVVKLKQAYKSIERTAWNKATHILKLDKTEFKVDNLFKSIPEMLTKNLEGAEPGVAAAVKILNLPAKYGKKNMALRKGLNAKLGNERSKISKHKKALALAKTDKQKETINKLISNTQERMSKLTKELNAVPDSAYLTNYQMMNTIKKINAKINIPGGNVSLHDENTIRTLRDVKTILTDALNKNIATSNPKAAKLLAESNKATVARIKAFGSSDNHAPKDVLVAALQSNDLHTVSKLLKHGEDGKGLENLSFVIDTLGKDSEAAKAAGSMYFYNRIGVDAEGLAKLQNSNKLFDHADRVAWNEAAAGMARVSDKELKVLEKLVGPKVVQEFKAFRKIYINYAEAGSLLQKQNVGINQGVGRYLTGEGVSGKVVPTLVGGTAGVVTEKVMQDDDSRNIPYAGAAAGSFAGFLASSPAASRGLRLIMDASKYYIAKTSNFASSHPIMANMPGASAGGGLYLSYTDSEDWTFTGLTASTLGGRVAGYQAGRVIRTVTEQDIQKVMRYIGEGRFKGKAVPREIQEAMKRIGNNPGGSELVNVHGGVMTKDQAMVNKLDWSPINKPTTPGDGMPSHLKGYSGPVGGAVVGGASGYADAPEGEEVAGAIKYGIAGSIIGSKAGRGAISGVAKAGYKAFGNPYVTGTMGGMVGYGQTEDTTGTVAGVAAGVAVTKFGPIKRGSTRSLYYLRDILKRIKK